MDNSCKRKAYIAFITHLSFPEILGELSMHEQGVTGSFFLCPRATAWEQDYRVLKPPFSHDVKQSGTPGQISWASAHFRD